MANRTNTKWNQQERRSFKHYHGRGRYIVQHTIIPEQKKVLPDGSLFSLPARVIGKTHYTGKNQEKRNLRDMRAARQRLAGDA